MVDSQAQFETHVDSVGLPGPLGHPAFGGEAVESPAIPIDDFMVSGAVHYRTRVRATITFGTGKNIAEELISDMGKLVDEKSDKGSTLDRTKDELAALQKNLNWITLLAGVGAKPHIALAHVLAAAANAVGGTAGLKTIIDLNAKLLDCDITVKQWVDKIKPPDKKSKGHKEWLKFKKAAERL